MLPTNDSTESLLQNGTTGKNCFISVQLLELEKGSQACTVTSPEAQGIHGRGHGQQRVSMPQRGPFNSIGGNQHTPPTAEDHIQDLHRNVKAIDNLH